MYCHSMSVVTTQAVNSLQHTPLRTVLFNVKYKPRNFKTVTFRGSDYTVYRCQTHNADTTTNNIDAFTKQITPTAQATPPERYALVPRSTENCCANPHSLHIEIRSSSVQTLSPTCPHTHTHTQRVPTEPTAFQSCLKVTGRSAVSKLCLLVAPSVLLVPSTIGYRLLSGL